MAVWIDDRFNIYWRREDNWWEYRDSSGQWRRDEPTAPLRRLDAVDLPPPVYVTEDGTTLVMVEGQQGDSAYQVAVKNGFVGTEKQWLATLKGPQGDLGPGSPFVIITQAEYDALPAPRPTNVLYVIR